MEEELKINQNLPKPSSVLLFVPLLQFISMSSILHCLAEQFDAARLFFLQLPMYSNNTRARVEGDISICPKQGRIHIFTPLSRTFTVLTVNK